MLTVTETPLLRAGGYADPVRGSDAAASPYLPTLGYLAGLDGVRALAVAAVVLYHLGWWLAPGGFLGVDVFFVLSGYLITSLLLVEHRRTGAINLGRFWLGRARRLLPAAVLVIVACLLVGILLVPSELDQLRANALASLLYVNNWRQIIVSHSYFAGFGRPPLLQHYWSLSVEEQFYLVWPVVLGLALAFPRGARAGRLAAGMAVAVVASVALMAGLYHPGVDPSRVYYGTDTRAAPLLIGALLAFAWPAGRMTARPGRAGAMILDGVGLIALGGLAVIMATAHAYDPWLYRGGLAVVAVVAAALIAVAAHPRAFVGRCLGTRPLRFVGQRSYGIYLWHWPVIALTRPGIDVRWSGWVVTAVRMALTFVLAMLSYRFVEMPVRRGSAWRALRRRLDGWRPRVRLVTVLAALAGSAAVVGGVAVAPNAVGQSPLDMLARALPSTRPAAASVAARASETSSGGVASTEAGVATGAPAAAVIGDSVAATISVVPQAQGVLERGLRLRLYLDVCRRLVQTSCTYDGDSPPPALAVIRSLGRSVPPILVIDVGYNDDAGIYAAGIGQVMHAALAQGARSVVWLTLRERGDYAPVYAASNAAIRRAARRWPQLRLADWNRASDGKPWFADDVHPNDQGAVALARFMHAAILAASREGGRSAERAVAAPRPPPT